MLSGKNAVSRLYKRFGISFKLISGMFLAQVILIWISHAPPLSAQDATEEFTAYLNEHIPGWMNRYDVPGVTVALIRQGEIIWSNAYGYADIKQGIRMTVDTVCRVESISKSVTARGVMKLVEEGRVSLDDPVQKYLASWELPVTDFDMETVTIRHLLSHSSGLSLGTIGLEYSPIEARPSLREYLTSELHFIQKPGRSFIYSNPGFNLLELLIEDVTGRDYSEYMQEMILTPMGMVYSSFEWREDFHTPIPNGYNLKGKPVPVYVYSYRAAGGLFATTHDIARFVASGMLNEFYSGENVLSLNSINELYSPVIKVADIYSLVSEYYGLGHFIESLPNGQKAVFNGGQGNGWMTHFHMVPETGDGIVILTNSQRSWPLFAHIVSDWAEWNGFGSVGMGLITKAITVLWILISLILAALIWQVIRVVRGIIINRRQMDVNVKNYSGIQFLQLGLFLILVSIFIYSITREYLIIMSVFPGISEWLMATLFIVALVQLLSAAFPQEMSAYGSDQNE